MHMQTIESFLDTPFSMRFVSTYRKVCISSQNFLLLYNSICVTIQVHKCSWVQLRSFFEIFLHMSSFSERQIHSRVYCYSSIASLLHMRFNLRLLFSSFPVSIHLNSWLMCFTAKWGNRISHIGLCISIARQWVNKSTWLVLHADKQRKTMSIKHMVPTGAPPPGIEWRNFRCLRNGSQFHATTSQDALEQQFL
jgi:hypothetical protein